MSAASTVLPPPATTGIPLNGVATSPDFAGSEGPVKPAAGGAVVDYEPFLPDQKYHRTSPPELLTLTEEQDAVYQEVLKYYAAEDYVIPDLEEGEGKLTEEERFYLVSLFSSLCRVGGAEDSNHLQTYECFLRCDKRDEQIATVCDSIVPFLGSFEPQVGTQPTA